MNDSEKLKIMLKDLIPCIEGKWFVGDGALLGLIRKGDLLEFDDDIDIFITPETKINWDKLPDKYNYYKDYICYKIYNGLGREPHKISPWIRYLQYMRLLPENRGCNRAELFKLASKTYREEMIQMNYKAPWLDIFVLNAVQKVYFVSKSEVKKWPLIGKIANQVGTVFIRRSRIDAIKQKNIFLSRITLGDKLLFFPVKSDKQRIIEIQ